MSRRPYRPRRRRLGKDEAALVERLTRVGYAAPDGKAILLCVPQPNSTTGHGVQAWCQYCHEWHYHGLVPPAHRTQHCWVPTSPHIERHGYYIVMDPSMTSDMEGQLSQTLEQCACLMNVCAFDGLMRNRQDIADVSLGIRYDLIELRKALDSKTPCLPSAPRYTDGLGVALEGLRSRTATPKLSAIVSVVLNMLQATSGLAVDEIAGGLKLAVEALPVHTLRPAVESALLELQEHGLPVRQTDGRYTYHHATS